jgi:hypothetical protein
MEVVALQDGDDVAVVVVAEAGAGEVVVAAADATRHVAVLVVYFVLNAASVLGYRVKDVAKQLAAHIVAEQRVVDDERLGCVEKPVNVVALHAAYHTDALLEDAAATIAVVD